MVKNHVMTVRLEDVEYNGISDAADQLEISKAEVIRRMYWTVSLLFNENFCLEDLIKNVNDTGGNIKLSDGLLHNIPEMIDMIVNKTSDDENEVY